MLEKPWLVVRDQAFYPSVERFADEDEARARFEEIQLMEDDSECVFIAEVKEKRKTKTYGMVREVDEVDKVGY